MNFFMGMVEKKITYNTEEPVIFNLIFISIRLLKKIVSKNWNNECLRKGFAVSEPIENGYQVVYVSLSTMTLFAVKTERPGAFKLFCETNRHIKGPTKTQPSQS